MGTRTTSSAGLLGIPLGACLTLAFAGLATSLGTLVQAPAALVQVLNTPAFAAAGWVTLELRRSTHVLEPALGATAIVLLFSGLSLALDPADALGSGSRLGALSSSAAAAFSTSWLGALIATGGRQRRSCSPRGAGGAPQQALEPRAPVQAAMDGRPLGDPERV